MDDCLPGSKTHEHCSVFKKSFLYFHLLICFTWRFISVRLGAEVGDDGSSSCSLNATFSPLWDYTFMLMSLPQSTYHPTLCPPLDSGSSLFIFHRQMSGNWCQAFTRVCYGCHLFIASLHVLSSMEGRIKERKNCGAYANCQALFCCLLLHSLSQTSSHLKLLNGCVPQLLWVAVRFYSLQYPWCLQCTWTTVGSMTIGNVITF